MSKQESKIQCQPLKTLHVVDRRDFIRDLQGNYILDPVNMQPQLNWKCACGKMITHSANYHGGEFVFIYDDAGASDYAAK